MTNTSNTSKKAIPTNKPILWRVAIERERRRRRAAQPEKSKPPQFRGANLEIQSYRGREWLLAGPSDTGKSVATVWLLDSLLRETPRANGVLARKLQTSIYGSVLVTYKRVQELRQMLGEIPAHPYGGEKPEFYTYPNGAKLWVGGMDNPNKMLSAERDFIYINQSEELKLEDWEILYTRCTGRGAQTKTPMIFGDCNPGAEDHWILKRETLKIFHSKHKDNPSIYDDDGNFVSEEAEQRIKDLQSLTGVRRKRLYDGLWVGAEGLFFEEFDEDRHTCDPFPIPADWPIWGALDYGYGHPTAFMLMTKDSNGVIYLIGEHVQNKWPVAFHCRAIRRMMARIPALLPDGTETKGIDPKRAKKLVAGHDLFQERGAEDGKKLSDQYQDAKNPEHDDLLQLEKDAKIGFKFEMANTARMTGSQEMLERLGNAKMGVAPTMKIFKGCSRTISAMTRMVADPKNPEEYLKVDADPVTGLGGDDEIDALRYAVMAEWRGRSEPMRFT